VRTFGAWLAGQIPAIPLMFASPFLAKKATMTTDEQPSKDDVPP
jgi:hypothetical protein